jgi:transitional endoplasmic reticulum ATPase
MSDKKVPSEETAVMKTVQAPRELKDIQKELERALTQRYQMAQGVNRDGKEIVVPAFMTLKDAAQAIMSFEKEMETDEDTIVELFAHPYDCCNAFHSAVSEIYGQMISATNFGFFGPMNGKCLTVPVGHNKHIKVPIGNTKVPGLPISMNLSVNNPAEWHPGELGATINFTHKRKYTPLIQEIETRTLEILKNESIFKGKALDSQYKFIDVERFNRDKVIYSEEQEAQLNANVFTVIKHTTEATSANIPVKRGILLHGSYGTGKTLTALYIASLCSENNWTFILVKPGDNISAAITLAQGLQPACVFFEDIDSVALQERDADVNEILNTIDGVLSKDSQVMVILTTNHIEKVNPAMLRPGRLDAIIKMGELDRSGIVKFININTQDQSGTTLLTDELNTDQICDAAQGYSPAFLKEAVSKATLYAIARNSARDAHNMAALNIASDDIVNALKELRPQWELMSTPRRVETTTIDSLISRAVRGLAEEAALEATTGLRLFDHEGAKNPTSNYVVKKAEAKK